MSELVPDKFVARPLTSEVHPASVGTDFSLDKGHLRVLGDLRLHLKDYQTGKTVFFFRKPQVLLPDGSLSVDLADLPLYNASTGFWELIPVRGAQLTKVAPIHVLETDLAGTYSVRAQLIDGIDREKGIVSLVAPTSYEGTDDVDYPYIVESRQDTLTSEGATQDLILDRADLGDPGYMLYSHADLADPLHDALIESETLSITYGGSLPILYKRYGLITAEEAADPLFNVYTDPNTSQTPQGYVPACEIAYPYPVTLPLALNAPQLYSAQEVLEGGSYDVHEDALVAYVLCRLMRFKDASELLLNEFEHYAGSGHPSGPTVPAAVHWYFPSARRGDATDASGSNIPDDPTPTDPLFYFDGTLVNLALDAEAGVEYYDANKPVREVRMVGRGWYKIGQIRTFGDLGTDGNPETQYPASFARAQESGAFLYDVRLTIAYPEGAHPYVLGRYLYSGLSAFIARPGYSYESSFFNTNPQGQWWYTGSPPGAGEIFWQVDPIAQKVHVVCCTSRSPEVVSGSVDIDFSDIVATWIAAGSPTPPQVGM